jgi:hypothetical protein
VTDIERMLTDIRFHAQIHGDARRTVLCQSSAEEAIREAVDKAGLAHLVKVVATPSCPDGKMLLLGGQAMEASFNAAVQRSVQSLRGMYRRY